MRKLGYLLVAGVAMLSGSAFVTAAHAEQAYNWSFTDSNGAVVGSGKLEMIDNIIVAKLTGTLYGNRVTFYPNRVTPWLNNIGPNNVDLQVSNPVPGMSQIVNVPNTTGANYGYDDIYDFNNGVTYVGGIAISTGTGSSLRIFLLTRDAQNYDITTSTDLFSINKDGSYSEVEGTLSLTP